MTNGTSQGLFIIIAVIIFGIFVLISYFLFGSKMKTSLANIFDDSLEQAVDNIANDTSNNNTGGNETPTTNPTIPDETVNIFNFDKATGTILGFKILYKHTSNRLEIPDEIEGVKVLAIGEHAFSSEKGITELKIGKNLKKVNNFGFANLELTELVVPDSVTFLGDGAFGKSILTKLTLSKNIENIGLYAFQHSKLTEKLDKNDYTYLTNVGNYNPIFK